MKNLDLKYYLAILRRWLAFVFVFWALISGIAVAIALVLPPVYRSTAKILVESQQISELLAKSTVDISSREQMQVLREHLMTRANLLDVAEQFGVYKDRPNLSPTDVFERMAAATELEELKLEDSRNETNARVFNLSFNANNAELSARVANQLATLILEQNVKIRTGRASETLEFFQISVDNLGAELAKMESEILAFKTANEDALPDSLEFRRNQITILQERLLQLERDDAALRETKANLEVALETKSGETTLSDQMTPNQAVLAGLRKDLAEQSAVYSETNPNLIALKSRIAALETLVREESKTAISPAGDALPSTLSGRMEQVTVRLEAVQKQRQDMEAEIKRLEESITLTPAIEVKLNSMERGYENIRIQYVEAQKKLAEAATGEQLELRQKGERFELIDQPTVPEDPISPNRKLVAIGGSVFGLFLALGIVFLVEMLNKSVRRPVDLVRELDIQPFATIPYVRTRGEVAKARLATTSWILALAGGLPAALWLIHTRYYPLDLLMQKVAEKTGLAELTALLGG